MLKLNLQYFGHLMKKTDSLEKTLMLGKVEGSRRRGRQTEDEMIEWHQQLDGHEFEQAPGVGDGQGSLACCRPWGHSQTWLSNWTELKPTCLLPTTFQNSPWLSLAPFWGFIVVNRGQKLGNATGTIQLEKPKYLLFVLLPSLLTSNLEYQVEKLSNSSVGLRRENSLLVMVSSKL